MTDLIVRRIRGNLRLVKLADHLLTGDLGHEKFNFAKWNADENGEDYTTPYECGTSGCAIGECPFVFPKDWRFNVEGLPMLGNSPGYIPDRYCNTVLQGAEFFFDITRTEANFLFVPSWVSDYIAPWNTGKVPLRDDATRTQVGWAIKRFVKYRIARDSARGN